VNNPKGDCYEAAAKLILAITSRGIIDRPDVRLVHAEVIGNGEVKGLRFGHAFLLFDDQRVLDISNGQVVVMSKERYYRLSGIDQIGNVIEYTAKEAIGKMCAYEHYGPWDLETESGL
jgi:hypothetical protein